MGSENGFRNGLKAWSQKMVYPGRPWSTLVDPGRPWSTMVDHGRPWSTVVDRADAHAESDIASCDAANARGTSDDGMYIFAHREVAGREKRDLPSAGSDEAADATSQSTAAAGAGDDSTQLLVERLAMKGIHGRALRWFGIRLPASPFDFDQAHSDIYELFYRRWYAAQGLPFPTGASTRKNNGRRKPRR